MNETERVRKRRKKVRAWWIVRDRHSSSPAEGWVFTGRMFAVAELEAQLHNGIKAELIHVQEVKP